MNTIAEVRQYYGKKAIRRVWRYAFSNLPYLWHDVWFHADYERRLARLLAEILESWRPPNHSIAAYAAAYAAAEREWQSKLLMEYLAGALPECTKEEVTDV